MEVQVSDMGKISKKIAKNIEFEQALDKIRKPIYTQEEVDSLVEEAGQMAFLAALRVINHSYYKMRTKDTRLKKFLELYLQEFKNIKLPTDINDVAKELVTESAKRGDKNA